MMQNAQQLAAIMKRLEAGLMGLLEEVRADLGAPALRDAFPVTAAVHLAAVAFEGSIYTLSRVGEYAGGHLTAHQREIAMLVKAGHTNSEIAKLLGLAEGTVAGAVQVVYRKLGVHSRVALAQHPDLLARLSRPER